MRECVNDAVRWYHRVVHNHFLLELRGRHDVVLDNQVRVHDKRVEIDEPEVFRIGELCQSVAHCDDLGPGHGCAVEIVVANMWEKDTITYAMHPLRLALGRHGTFPAYVRFSSESRGRRTMFIGIHFPVLLDELRISRTEPSLVHDGDDYRRRLSGGHMTYRPYWATMRVFGATAAREQQYKRDAEECC